jgi:L-alanine-DL-glutamate epimerase-like enolase superfamily enzyme
MSRSRLTLEVHNENLRLKEPFAISGYTFNESPITVVTLRDGRCEGRGEAAGVYYLNDTSEKILTTIEAHRDLIESGLTREELSEALPAGGARNAIDCALWDLEACRTGKPAWQLAGIQKPRPLLTTFTLSAKSPNEMAEGARVYATARAIKMKLTGEVDLDIERIRAVRGAQPDVWLGVDANQGYVRAALEKLLPVLSETRVSLLEQPCRRGQETDLDGIDHTIPIAADESLQSLDEVEALAGRFDVVNIKLDKCGGLTEGLLIGERARALGMKVMVGNMIGTSWAMAPAFILGQQCDVVDLDGPIFLTRDREPGVIYEEGLIRCPDEVWGAGRRSAA